MKEALYYKKKRGGIIHCQLCPKHCIIQEGKRGNCGVRVNIDGKLYSIVYGEACSIAVDPIEKKPLYHFLPGSKTFSIGTAGCNLHCKHCQNWEISQADPEEIPTLSLSPKQIIEEAKEKGCNSIAYTYTEPTVFWEYVLDTAKLAHKEGLKNIIVSNGFINPKPLEKGCKYIDAANIDLKGNALFYQNFTDAQIEPVLNSLKLLKDKDIWLEVTNLIIPSLNDSSEDLKDRCNWIKENLGTKTPIHFSRFFPCYRMMDIKPTSFKLLEKAYGIAKMAGLKFIYLGNVAEAFGNDTFCPSCGNLLIRRGSNYCTLENNINDKKCSKCNQSIKGVWE